MAMMLYDSYVTIFELQKTAVAVEVHGLVVGVNDTTVDE